MPFPLLRLGPGETAQEAKHYLSLPQPLPQELLALRPEVAAVAGLPTLRPLRSQIPGRKATNPASNLAEMLFGLQPLPQPQGRPSNQVKVGNTIKNGLTFNAA